MSKVQYKRKYKNYQNDSENVQFISQELKSDLLICSDLFVGLGNFDFFNSKKEFLKKLLKADLNSTHYEE